MREGANRRLAVAVLASILLHALLLAYPFTRELSALTPPEPAPLVARVERPQPPPAPPRPAAREVRKPEPPRLAPQTKPALPAPGPAPMAAAPPPAAPAPQPAPAPAPAPRAEPGVVATVAPPAPVVDTGALERYRQALTRAAARFKRYPRAAIDNGWEGEVVVRVRIGADGRLASLRVIRSSGHEVLDLQALQMFDNAGRFVPVPAELRGQACEIELRAIYDLRDQRSG